MKRFIIMNGSEEVGKADNTQEIVKVLGCSRTHYYNAFDGKHLVFKGVEYTIIDVVAYYYYSGYREQIEN